MERKQPISTIHPESISEDAILVLASGGRNIYEFARFELHRQKVEGVGIVASGVLMPDGRAVVTWHGEHPTCTVHHHGLESVKAIHGHDGSTAIVWPDHQDVELAHIGMTLAWAPTDGGPRGQGWVFERLGLDHAGWDPKVWQWNDEGRDTLARGDCLDSVDGREVVDRVSGRGMTHRQLRRCLYSEAGTLAATEVHVARLDDCAGGDPASIRLALA